MRIQCSCLAWISDADRNSCFRGYVLKEADREKFTKSLSKGLSLSDEVPRGKRGRTMTFLGGPAPAIASSTEVELRERVDELLRDLLAPVYECRNCSRIFLLEGRGSKHFARFEPEYTTRRSVLA